MNKGINRRLLVLLAIIGLLLSGCSLAPKYTQPAAPIPAEWPQGSAYKKAGNMSDKPVVSDLRWEDFFVDSQLQKVIALALENNRDLRLAALNVERAQALYGIRKAELFPAVDAVAGGGRQRRSTDLIAPGESPIVEQYRVNLGIIAWEADFFGRIRSLKDQALEAYLATDEARRGAQITLVAEVARVYLTLAANRENLILAQSTLASQQDAYGLVKKRFDVGIAAEIDLWRAQIPVETARRNVAIYTQRVAQDKNSMNLLAGNPVPESLLPTDLSHVIPLQELSAGLTSNALLQRPDILAAEHQLRGAYAFIGAARAAFFPRISLTTTFGTASDELSGLFNSGTKTWNFAPQIALPIFDARTWAAYRVSKADQKIAVTRYEKTIQIAFREVADALVVQGTVDQQVSAQQSLVKAVAETYRLADRRYNQGIDSYLGVLDAQQSLFSAQQVLVLLRLSKFTSQVQLYAVLGGGALETIDKNQ